MLHCHCWPFCCCGWACVVYNGQWPASLDIFIISDQTSQCPDLCGEGTAGALRERVAVIVCESLHCPPDDRRLTWLFHLISLDIAEWFVLMIAIVSCVLS